MASRSFRLTRRDVASLTLHLITVPRPLSLEFTLPVFGYSTNGVPLHFASMSKHFLVEQDTATNHFLGFHSMRLPNLMQVNMNPQSRPRQEIARKRLTS